MHGSDAYNISHIIVSFVPGISYLICGTVVYGVPQLKV